MIQRRTLQILENSRSVVNSRNFEDEANNVQLDKKDTQLKQLEYLSVTLVLKYPDILSFSYLFLVCLLILTELICKEPRSECKLLSETTGRGLCYSEFLS